MIQHGYLAEYADEQSLLAATRAIRVAGYTHLDAFTPYPVKGLQQALGLPRSHLAYYVFPLAALGAVSAYALQWYVNARSYPINVGGRPLYSGPAWIPVTFESAILTAGLVTFVLFLALNRYPEPRSPIFDVPGFERASIDTFWLAIDSSDPRFDAVRAAQDLRSTSPLRIGGLGMEVP